MSIFTKVLFLFVLSFGLMIFVSNKTNKFTQDIIESLLKERYIQVSDELFKYLSNNDTNSLYKKLKELKFEIIKEKEYHINDSKIVYTYETTLSIIKILKDHNNKYLLYMNYLDDDILVIDMLQDKNLKEKEFLNYMILTDILILIILFLIILKMIYPLKNISKRIKDFGDGDYGTRIYNNNNDEIGELSTTFNLMASNIEELILSRQRLLRDIGHELRTPIAKSKFAIEMMTDNKYKKILNNALVQMDEMTNELLHIEKLNANQHKLSLEKFNVETLISVALSKLFIEDETLINISLKSNFSLKADLEYLSIAIKNLIDNALKYSEEKPILIVVENKNILIKSRGEKLNKSLEFYCEAFTQNDSSREQKGYGLGLSLVKRILDKHNFVFSYFYDDGYNIFSISI